MYTWSHKNQTQQIILILIIVWPLFAKLTLPLSLIDNSIFYYGFGRLKPLCWVGGVHRLGSTLLCYISLVKYSTGWRPPIGWCRSETDLPQPNLTNFDPVFCKKYLVIWIWENTFFLGPHGHFFGPGEAFFSTFWRFAKIEGRPSILANYLIYNGSGKLPAHCASVCR